MNKQKLTYALGVAAFLGSAALFPALADNTTVAGNGAFSGTQVQTSSNNSTDVSQTNNTQAVNQVQVSNNTGNNTASFNTGAVVGINTGAANANVGISNTAGSNTAQVSGGSNGGQNTTVAGNGAFSENGINSNSNSNTSLSQTNNTNFANDVNVNNNTGKNSADFNTGGSVSINTGPANAWVGISNTAGSNQAAVSGGNSGTGTSTVVAGNGAFSNSNVNSNSNNSTSLNQQNDTNFSNVVHAYNNTGNNSADFNTGSNVSINTGTANAWVGIQNLAGQNTAFVQGGMSGGGGNGSIAVIGNGAFSNNNVSQRNDLRTALEQENLTTVVNYISTMNNTGNNTASFNTGGYVNLTTGSANSGVNVFNTAGSNDAYVFNPSYFANAALTEILGNGAFSYNNVNSNAYNSNSVKQKNYTSFTNNIREKNSTGNNKSSYGTGSFMPYMSYSNCGCSTQNGYSYGSGMSSLYSGEANAYMGSYNQAAKNSLYYY
jgi:hypothetical protein